MFLIDPINKGDIEKIKYLVEKEGILDKDDDRMNSWPITCAARTGNLEIVKYLFEKGVTIKGTHAIEESCRSGKLEIIKFLVENGAKIQPDDICRALRHRQLEIVKYFISIETPQLTENTKKRIDEIVKDTIKYRQELLPILDYKFNDSSYIVLDYLEYDLQYKLGIFL